MSPKPRGVPGTAAYEKAIYWDSSLGYRLFLQSYPDDGHALRIYRALTQRQEETAWAEAVRAGDAAMEAQPGQIFPRVLAFDQRIGRRMHRDRARQTRTLERRLDPHAGEDGALGEEDAAIVAPAVEHLRAEGIDAVGPLPADSLFHERARAAYDVALCMYHDQALIPIKTLAFDHAVNVTLGLPFVRTSPDHGTAFDIAGKGTADPSSLVASISLAARLSATAPTLVPAK